MRIFCCALFLAVALAPAPPWPPKTWPVTVEPRLGAAPPPKIPSEFRILAGSSQLSPAYRVRYQGVVYDVGTNQEGKIAFISTSESSFVTPEGIRKGDRLEKVRKLTGIKEPASWEPGWSCFIRLRSGWNAAFDFARDGKCDHGDSRVTWFFQRDR